MQIKEPRPKAWEDYDAWELHYNVGVFAAFKNHSQIREVGAVLADQQGQLRTLSKFKKVALATDEHYNLNWLRAEYQTAVL